MDADAVPPSATTVEALVLLNDGPEQRRRNQHYNGGIDAADQKLRRSHFLDRLRNAG